MTAFTAQVASAAGVDKKQVEVIMKAIKDVDVSIQSSLPPALHPRTSGLGGKCSKIETFMS